MDLFYALLIGGMTNVLGKNRFWDDNKLDYIFIGAAGGILGLELYKLLLSNNENLIEILLSSFSGTIILDYCLS